MLTRTFRHARNCIKHTSPAQQRAFCVSQRCLQHQVDEENVASSSVKVRKTKKKLSELPKARILPDGSIAAPLGDWWAGEDRSAVPPENDILQSPNLIKNIAKGKRRVNRTPPVEESLPELLVVDETLEEVTAAPKPKRRRKSPAVSVESNEADPQTTPTTTTTESGEGTAVPKKAKRTRKSAVVEEAVEDDGRPRNILAREILENLAKFPHCLLLTRVGQFYESYFDQAKEIAQILNIKLTTRKWDGRRIAMCGFPIMHIDKYLKIMVQQHKRFVAMCEEFPRYSKDGVREFDRRVVRVITPGTLIDESFLNQYENNYLLAISTPDDASPAGTQDSVGLAWIDVSTGEFFTKASTYQGLRDEITRIGPREIVLHKRLEFDIPQSISEALTEEENVVSYAIPSGNTPYNNSTEGNEVRAESLLEISDSHHEQTQVELKNEIDASSFIVTDEVTSMARSSPVAVLYTAQEHAAIDLLTSYLRTNLLDHMPPLLLPNREDSAGRMQIDSHTIKALEIRESMREGGTRGSLLSVVKRTVTSSGTRLLARWLCSPSTSISEIHARQSLVAFFHSRPHFRADLTEVLAQTEDAGRIVQKFLLGRGQSNDLLAINSAIRTWIGLKHRIDEEKRMESLERRDVGHDEWSSLDALMSRMVDLRDLSRRIDLSLEKSERAGDSSLPSGFLGESLETETSDNSPRTIARYGQTRWAIKPEFSEQLTELHATLQELLKQKETLEETFQLRYDAPSLTLRSSPAQGMHVHIAKSKRDQAQLNTDSAFISIAESNSTKCYFHQEWSLLGGRIFETSMSLLRAEKEAFEILRDEVNSHAPLLRRNTRILDELDVTLAFANLASEMNFVRPVVQDDTTYDVTNGRHPTVELGLLTSGRVFTPNSVQMTPTSRLHVITGPNMAGKSTLLRQTALITILAQTGSFVPADSAVLGVVDKLFSRVGAKDDLFHDRSTFMVEMLETAEILSRATPRSLVIMDEVGRGTTVKDGLAIAFGTVHHLVAENQCRTLFATHFHELSDMLGYSDTDTGRGAFETVSFLCTDVDETDDGHFAYSYRVRPGVNRNSHGLKVARLAGMPQSAIEVAQKTLALLEGRTVAGFDAKELGDLGQSLIQ